MPREPNPFWLDAELINGVNSVTDFLAYVFGLRPHPSPGRLGNVIQRIRRRERNLGVTPIPIVALTAHAMAGDRERFLAAGMNDCLSKPFDIADLRRVLNTYGRTQCML